MTELAVHQPAAALTFADQWRYAEAVSTANMLPQNYRNKPADIMLAVGLGQAMGLSPAESLYRIDVIQGKPTAGAELIAANVRKAGHKLRVKGTETSCTATIIRADDPDFEFTVTRDVEWARAMGLSSKDNYKKQPGTMLQWRAITAVARLACPEALYGVAYTADEMQDAPQRDTAPPVSVAAFTAEPVEHEPSGVDEFTEAGHDPVTDAQLRKMHAAFSSAGIVERDDRLAYVNGLIDRQVESSKDLSKSEASQVIDALEASQPEPLWDGGEQS